MGCAWGCVCDAATAAPLACVPASDAALVAETPFDDARVTATLVPAPLRGGHPRDTRVNSEHSKRVLVRGTDGRKPQAAWFRVPGGAILSMVGYISFLLVGMGISPYSRPRQRMCNAEWAHQPPPQPQTASVVMEVLASDPFVLWHDQRSACVAVQGSGEERLHVLLCRWAS